MTPDPTMQKEIEELGHLTLEDLKEVLKTKVSPERAIEVSNIILKLMVEENIKPSEGMAGAVVLIMKILATPLALERLAAGGTKKETPIQ